VVFVGLCRSPYLTNGRCGGGFGGDGGGGGGNAAAKTSGLGYYGKITESQLEGAWRQAALIFEVAVAPEGT